MIAKELEKKQLLLILLPSVTFIALLAFSGSLVQSAHADFNFGAVGDYGCNSNTQKSLNNIKDHTTVELHLALGDYSYQSTGSCWFDLIDSSNLKSRTRIAIGNHEDESSEGFSGYMSFFGLSQTYYSYNYENVHVLVMDTDRNSYSSGSSQYNFVVNDLQSASQNPNIDWIIVYLHKQMYTSPNTCGSSSCSNTGSDATNLRNIYHAKFDQYGVDLVLNGHLHNYQRTYPIKYDSGSPSSPTVTDSASTNYIDPQGQIFATVGTGGINFHALSGKSSFVKYQQDDDFGILDIAITNNGDKLLGRYYANDGSKLDEFSITKVSNSPPVANNQAVTAVKNTAKAITLTATDSNNDPLTYSIVTPPAHGTITGGTGASRTYTPNSNYVGPDSFTFKANDGKADSNTATVSLTVQDPASCATNLPISAATASGSQSGYPPENAIDNNFGTRWSNSQSGSWIRVDLGSTQNICSVDIAWYSGNTRQYNFVIATSTDGTTFTNKFSGKSSGTTTNSEKYFFSSTNARYVRVTVNGNTQNSYASMYEIDVFSSSAPPSSCTGSNLAISAATASGSQSGYPPENAIDNNFGTRWSNSQSGSWIRVDLGSTQNICSVDIAWFNGDQRQYNFVVATSTDGTTFTNVFSGLSSGTTTSSEKYSFASTNARYVRVTVNGNTQNSYASMYEIDVTGSSSSSSSCTGSNLAIGSATASGSQSGYPPENAIDNNFGTRWSNSQSGSWIRVDLGSTQNICSVDIAWFSGNTRQYNFAAATSTDGTTFTNVFSGLSSGTTTSSEKYSFASTDARYVRVTVNGNTQNSYASMYEIDLFGASSAASLYNFEPSLSLSGPS